MGFGDRLKGLREQAQQTVAEHKEQIQGAVETVGVAANEKTHGKYADRITKVGEKVSAKVEKIAAADSEPGAAQAPSFADAPVTEPSSVTDSSASAPPAFADDPVSEPPTSDTPAPPPPGHAPEFE